MNLIVMAGVYSELDHNRYDYMPIMDIRNMFEKLRIEIFDQSYLRRGNRQNLNFQNCEGKTIKFELSDVSRNLRFPVEFLKKISSTPGLINHSELMKLPEREFQNRINSNHFFERGAGKNKKKQYSGSPRPSFLNTPSLY